MGYHHSLSPRAAALQLAFIVGAILTAVCAVATIRTLAYREGDVFWIAVASGICLMFFLAGFMIGVVAAAGRTTL